MEQGRPGLDDPIVLHFEGVPVDKQAVNVRHLLTGQSGLPDFLETTDDWNPDLDFIDWADAERLLLAA